MSEEYPGPERRRFVSRHHHQRSLLVWLVPLAVILAIMFFLPRLTALLFD